MYYGFENKKDICQQFAVKDFDGVVVHAEYNQECYEGDATVIFVDKGKFYISKGSHCSCYGLENQWEPEEITAQTLLHMLRKGHMMRGKSGLADGLERLMEVIEDRSDQEIEVLVRLMF